jgi:hypothetical protein
MTASSLSHPRLPSNFQEHIADRHASHGVRKSRPGGRFRFRATPLLPTRRCGKRRGEYKRKCERRAQDRSAAAAFAVFSFGFAVPCRAAWLMQGQRKAVLHILGLAVSDPHPSSLDKINLCKFLSHLVFMISNIYFYNAIIRIIMVNYIYFH